VIQLIDLLGSESGSLQTSSCLVDWIANANAFTFDQQVSSLDDEHRHRACLLVAGGVRGRSSMSALETGALLFLFRAVTPELSAKEQFEEMEEETGIKRSQLYRLINLFESFGRELLPEPDLVARCTCEGLKLLSGSSVPPAARAEAIESIRKGKFLTIKEAKSIRRKHKTKKVFDGRSSENGKPKPPTGAESSADGLQKNARNVAVLWKFSEPKLRIEVYRNCRDGCINGESIIYALEAALERARSEYMTADSIEPSQVA
jgi:hypothetical protein